MECTKADTPAPVASSTSSAAPTTALCASCDRCRARKTKCDGKRPCGNCAAKYLKKHKLASIEGIDISLFGCVYSPAKRRGPVPGRISRKNSTAAKENQSKTQPFLSGRGNPMSTHPLTPGNVTSASGLSDNPMFSSDQTGMLQHLENQKQKLSALLMKGEPSGSIDEMLQAQQRSMLLQAQTQLNGFNLNAISDSSGIGLYAGGVGSNMYGANSAASNNLSGNQLLQAQQLQAMNQAHKEKMQEQGGNPNQRMKMSSSESREEKSTPKYIAKYEPLLGPTNQEGNMLRSYYEISVNELFRLPPIPTDEEFCLKLPLPISVSQMSRGDACTLKAGRFAELALGAQANYQVSLALELSNATVVCLRESIADQSYPCGAYDKARAYFLHAVLRSFRGDFERYFKYRRICLTHMNQLKNTPDVSYLFAAIAFQDSWSYSMYNASESNLPDISVFSKPCVSDSSCGSFDTQGKCNPASIACNPNNKMWIQGIPPVFTNNDAPPLGRSLDALACAIRGCCDQANVRFEMMKNAAMATKDPNATMSNPAATVIESYKDEYCSRNMVTSARTLLQADEAISESINKNYGHTLVISAMEAFLENGDGEEADGFTDSQVQSILLVCNMVLERPLLLHMGGPVYHIVSNCAILLCHLLNGMYASISNDKIICTDMEKALYGEILDTFLSIRKLLHMHRRKLPTNLRCHSIPRPNFTENNAEVLIDLSETVMCSCKGCQGFALMGCSPCVAAERAQRSQMDQSYIFAREHEGEKEIDELGRDDLLGLGDDAELDEALLSVLAQLIST